jgi:hypothetical protein
VESNCASVTGLTNEILRYNIKNKDVVRNEQFHCNKKVETNRSCSFQSHRIKVLKMILQKGSFFSETSDIRPVFRGDIGWRVYFDIITGIIQQ